MDQEQKRITIYDTSMMKIFRSRSNWKWSKPFRKKYKIDEDSTKEDKKEFIKNNELILKAQQRFKTKKYVFTQEINKIALSSNDNKRIQSIDWIETYAFGMSKDLVIKTEEIKCNNIIKRYIDN